MKRSKTEGIVVHRAEVWTNLDYNFIILQSGAIVRNVPVDERGEHAKDYNGTTIGIAVFGDFAALEPGKNKTATAEQLDALTNLIRTLNGMFGMNLWVAGHSELGTKGTNVATKLIVGHTCPGENFPLKDVIARSGCKAFAPVTTLS